MITIRPYQEQDWLEIWQVIHPVFRAGDTYAFAPDISEEEARLAWVKLPTATFVAEDEQGSILGTYYLKPNQPGLGAHVCNCAYVVRERARGQGIASMMCEHSQREALTLGFRAMQFNLVVSSNTAAVRLWQRLGFEIVGTLPQAFRHAELGFVDAYVMYKLLG